MNIQYMQASALASQVSLELLMIQAQALSPPEASWMEAEFGDPSMPKPLLAYAHDLDVLPISDIKAACQA